MRLRTLFLVAVSLAALVGGLWYWRKSEETAARRLETWREQERLDATVVALDRSYEWPAGEVSLAELAALIDKQNGMAVDIDRLAIESEGENLNRYRFDIPGSTLSVASLLRLTVESHGLAYDVHDGRLSITTQDASRDRNRLRTVVYPLPQPEPSAARVSEDQWVALVTSLVHVNEWQDVGGQGHCEPVPGGLVIVQTNRVHRDLRRLLEQVGTLLNPPESLAPVVMTPRDFDSVGRGTWRKLTQPVSLRCTDRPLALVLQDLAGQSGLPIHLNRHRLEEAGVNPDNLVVSQSLENVSLASLLHLLLDEIELAFYVRDAAVEVTTPEDAESPDNMVTVAYPVHDLVDLPGGRDFDSLIELIVTTVAPESWSDVGGPALVGEEVDGWLLISQTGDVHEQIEQLLTQIRHTLAYDAAPPIFGVPLPSAAEQRIHAALDLKIPLRFTGTPLKEAVASIGRELGIPTHLFRKKLEEAGTNADERVTCVQTDLPVRERLQKMLRPLELSYLVHHDVLQITTLDDTESSYKQLVRIHDTRTLADPDLGVLDEDSVEEILHTMVAPDSWTDSGGGGASRYFRGLAIVAQSQELHNRIAELLSLIERHCLARPASGDQSPRVVELSPDPANSRLEALIAQPVKLQLTATTSYAGLLQVAEQVGIPVVIENNCLTETLEPTLNIAPVNETELTLAGVLERILVPCDLHYIVEHGQLVVAHSIEAGSSERAKVRLYRMGDLPAAIVESQTALIARLANETNAAAQVDHVIRPVGKHWLCVSGSSELHERIADALTQMRTGELPRREAERRKLAEELKAANELRIEQETDAFLNRPEVP
jgi:hypothetical protein